MSVVLDASALLAFLHNEPGAGVVEPLLNGGRVSAVNWAEVVQKALKRKVDASGMREAFVQIGLSIEPFTPAQAEAAAHLWSKCRDHGMSLADRSCLALALELDLPVLTGDRVWSGLDVGVEVRLFR